MKIKHLLFYGLFVFIYSDSLIAQRVNVTAETDSFTDYELVNDSDKIFPPYQLLVPVVNGEPAFKILEQSIVEIDRSLSESEISAAFISSDEVNVIETAGIGIYRGHKKAQMLFHRVRYTPKSLLVTRKLKVRVYKNDGDRVVSSKKRFFADSPFHQELGIKSLSEKTIFINLISIISVILVLMLEVSIQKISSFGVQMVFSFLNLAVLPDLL